MKVRNLKNTNSINIISNNFDILLSGGAKSRVLKLQGLASMGRVFHQSYVSFIWFISFLARFARSAQKTEYKLQQLLQIASRPQVPHIQTLSARTNLWKRAERKQAVFYGASSSCVSLMLGLYVVNKKGGKNDPVEFLFNRQWFTFLHCFSQNGLCILEAYYICWLHFPPHCGAKFFE